MEVHEVCSIFPLMSEEEFAGLKADVQAHGQREPVWTYQGKVIDGRNRLRACQELGIAPQFREWDGNGSLVEFVVSLNLHRRHLTSGQKAACGTEIEERLAKEAEDRRRELCRQAALKQQAEQREKRENKNPTPRLLKTDPDTGKTDPGPGRVPERIPEPSPRSAGEARTQASKLVGSNPRYIQDAKAVKEKAPDLHKKVKDGEMTLPQAKREVVRRSKRDEAKVKEEEVKKATPSDAHPSWSLIEGDCIEALGTIEPGSVRLVFADPPYNIGIDYGDHHDDKMPADDFLRWSEDWMRAAARTLAPDGSMWVLINDEWADEFGCILRRIGLHRRSWIKWYESFGVNTSSNFNRCSRHLFYMVRDPRRFVFNADAVSRPSDRQAKYGDKRADPGGKVWDNVWGINPEIPRLVENARERLPDFPTQLPLALLMPIVGCASGPGDLVLDPFSGSGTTGEACIRLGRRFVGIENSSHFASLARMRLTAARRD